MVQAPLTHESLPVQNRPSWHVVPSGRGAIPQTPDVHTGIMHSLPPLVSGQSASTVHSQRSEPSLQTNGALHGEPTPSHDPVAVHVSVAVQKRSSSQLVPGLADQSRVFVAGSQTRQGSSDAVPAPKRSPCA